MNNVQIKHVRETVLGYVPGDKQQFEDLRAKSYRIQLQNLARRAWADGVVLSVDRRMDGPPCAANQQMVVDAWPARGGPFSAKRPITAGNA